MPSWRRHQAARNTVSPRSPVRSRKVPLSHSQCAGYAVPLGSLSINAPGSADPVGRLADSRMCPVGGTLPQKRACVWGIRIPHACHHRDTEGARGL
jgi:hypothetical protein